MSRVLQCSIPGPVLGTLLYSTLSPDGDCAGFLFGDVLEECKMELNDFGGNKSRVTVNLNISSFVRMDTFFDAIGSIFESVGQYLEKTCKENNCKLVGWYNCRRAVPLRSSLRDISVHENLMHLLANIPDIGTGKELLMLLLSSDSAFSSLSVQDQSFRATVCDDGGKHFNNVPLLIENLENNSAGEYSKLGPHSSADQRLLPDLSAQVRDMERHVDTVMERLKKEAHCVSEMMS